MKEFDELYEICKISNKLCPWSIATDAKGFANEVRNEADELIEAVEDGDIKEITSELGDVMNDCIQAAITLNIPIENVLKSSTEKIKRRKPFLAEGKMVTLEEAKAIWKKVKEEEINEKTE